MACLVAGFHVEVDEVIASGGGSGVCAEKGIDGGLGLAFEVGIVEARGAWDVDDAEAGVVTDAANKIHSGDDGAAMDLIMETLGDGGHLRAISPTPWPDAGCHVTALARAFLINIMLRQELLGAEDEVAQESGGGRGGEGGGREDFRANTRGTKPASGGGRRRGGGRRGGRRRGGGSGLDLVIAPGLEGDVVGRGAEEVLVATADDEEVTVLDAGVETDTATIVGIAGEVFVEIVNEGCCLFGIEAPAGVVLQDVAFDADEVAAEGEVAGLEFHTDGSSLEGATPLVDEVLVIAEDAAVGNFAAGMKAIRHRLQEATAAVGCKPVHGRSIGVLKECLSSEGRHVPVGHAVAKDD